MDVGQKRIYSQDFPNRKDVILWEVLSVAKNQAIKITFLSKKSQHRQGIRVAIDSGDGTIEVNGTANKGIVLWEDSAPREVILDCKSDSGLVSLYNVYDKGKGMQSQSNMAGMLREESEQGVVYRCNDFGAATDFDKLIFRVQLLA